jgi:hypothetical protein
MNNNGVYEHFRILDSNSEEVRELEDRWISGDVRYADEVRHKYSGFSDTKVYAILDGDGAPIAYIEVDLTSDSGIEEAYDEYLMTHSGKAETTVPKRRYSNFIMEAVRQNMGLDEDDTSMDDEIMKMDGEEVVRRYLEWEGIIGYASDIIEVVSQAVFGN